MAPKRLVRHPFRLAHVRFLRARRRTASRRVGRGARIGTVLVCLLAGLMIVTSALSARGTDLRPSRNTDLVGLLTDEKRRNADLAHEVAELRAEVDSLSNERNARSGDQPPDARADEFAAGSVPVRGPSVTVTLSDAPASVQPDGVDDDELVVHQQDIQSVVNALWSGGAEAMTIQGQRVISTTGIKCVGNTVVLHGVPYAPPYVITAIGDPLRLEAALASSDYLKIYQQYVEAYGLGYQQTKATETYLPAFEGAQEMRYASVPGKGQSSESPR
ncbi:MAG: DUF881 domain-containing protein [Propionibacteriales bacterium]|nr:DUF881 domain-containing protein [Propionibacteriales bacterium]